MQITYFPLNSFKLVSCSDHVVQEIPNLPFFKEAIDFESVFNFPFQYIRKIIVYDLFLLKYLHEGFHSIRTFPFYKTHTSEVKVVFTSTQYHRFASFLISITRLHANFI